MSRISIQRYESEGQVRFSVLLDRRTALADFYNERWATTFAEVAEALMPVALGHDTTLRYIYDGLLSLAHTRFLVAGVLERAAELRQARALESLNDAERAALTTQVEALRLEVRKLLLPREK